MNLPDTSVLVPHGGAMSLLDRVVAADGEHLCAEVAIGAGTLFATGDGVGAWIGIEYMAQAVAAHAGFLARRRGEAVRVGFLLGTRRYACTTPVFAPGSVLRVEARCELAGETGLGAYACRIVDGAAGGEGADLASATITVFQPDDVDEFLQRSAE